MEHEKQQRHQQQLVLASMFTAFLILMGLLGIGAIINMWLAPLGTVLVGLVFFVLSLLMLTVLVFEVAVE